MEKRTKARKTRNERNRVDEGCLRPLSRSKKWNTWYSRLFSFLEYWKIRVFMHASKRDKSKQDRFLYIFWTWKFLLIICINIMIYIYLYLLIIIVFIIGLFIFVFLTTFERDGFIKKSWIVYLISILYICNIVDYKYLLIHL